MHAVFMFCLRKHYYAFIWNHIQELSLVLISFSLSAGPMITLFLFITEKWLRCVMDLPLQELIYV